MQKAPNKGGENSNKPAFHFPKGLMLFDPVQPKTTLIDVNIDSLEKNWQDVKFLSSSSSKMQ